jgi:hypothetical protein
MLAALAMRLVLTTLALGRVPAPARLAEALGDADSVEWARADREHGIVTFGVELAGEAYEIVATIHSDGEVVGLEIRDRGLGMHRVGGLSWIADLMHDTHAVTRLLVGDDGGITLVTDDGEQYRAIEGAESRTNDRVRARWAAAWDQA